MRNLLNTIFIASVLVMFLSCSRERQLEEGDTGQNNAEVVLNLKTPGDFGTTQSRALSHNDENKVTDIYVLVFDNTNKLTAIKSGTGVSATPGTSGDTYSGSGSFSVTLTPSKTAADTYNLIVLANASSILSATIGTDVSAIADKSYSTVMAKIWDTITGKMYTSSGSTIPMWGESGALVVEASRNNQTVILKRCVSRIDVGVGAASGTPSNFSWDGKDEGGAAIPFVLESVHVMRPNNRYAVAPDVTAVTGTPTVPAGTTAFTATESVSLFAFATTAGYTTREIYIPEANILMGVSGKPADANHTNRMAIVVGGKYNGGSTTYYRLDFASGGNLMNVLRNHLYQFNISGVSGDGFPDPVTAYESQAMNMTVNILEWNQTDMGSVVISGQNYLSISPGEIELSKLAETGVTFTAMTNVAAGWVVSTTATTTPGGTEATWIKNISGSFSAVDTRENVTFDVEENTSGAVRTAYIKVTAGRLEFFVKVTQGITIPLQINITDLEGNPLSVLSFAADNGTSGVAPAAQAFKVTWTPADRPVSIARTQTGVEPFTWQDASNALIELPVGGSYTFTTVNPTAITTGLPFNNRASILTFTITDGTSTALKSIQLFQGVPLTNVAPTLTVSTPNAISYAGGTETVNITSSATADGVPAAPVAWIAEFSTDGGVTWTTTSPEWLTFPASGAGSTTPAAQSAVAAMQPVTTGANTENSLLRSATVQGTSTAPYDLSTKGGATSRNTANCYVVNAAGQYKLPLVYGNAIKAGVTNSSAYSTSNSGTGILSTFKNHADANITDPNITGADNAVLVWMDHPGLIVDVKLVANELVFETAPKETITQGNAIVAVRNSSGTILWSWHIWITPTTIFNANALPIANSDATKNHANNGGAIFNIMKYNLGWCTGFTTNYGTAERSVKVRITQVDIENPKTETVTIIQNSNTFTTGGNSPFWQFGRKDPMPPSDGTTANIDKPTMVYATGYSYEPTAGPVSLGIAIQNPHKFYYNSGDWNNGGGYINLWSRNNIDEDDSGTTVVKTVYDPSPVGFQIPNRNTWTGLTKDGANKSGDSNRNNLNVVDNTATAFFTGINNIRGWTFFVGGWQLGATVFYPASGHRKNTSSSPTSINSTADYWSAGSYSLTNGRSFGFHSGGVSPLNNYNRSFGFVLRCATE